MSRPHVDVSFHPFVPFGGGAPIGATASRFSRLDDRVVVRGAAMFQILARFYGRDDISFTFTSDDFNGVTVGADGQVRPVVSRTFSSLSAAKFENAQSRIYLGIHWSFDRDEGIKTGNSVADYVFENVIQPRHGSGRRPEPCCSSSLPS